MRVRLPVVARVSNPTAYGVGSGIACCSIWHYSPFSVLGDADDPEDGGHCPERGCPPAPQSAALIFPGDVVGQCGLESVLAVAKDLAPHFLEVVTGVAEVHFEGQDGIVDVLDEFPVGFHRGILESSGAGGRITGCPFSALGFGWGPCSISLTQNHRPFGSYCPWVVIRRQHEHQRVLYISRPLCPRLSVRQIRGGQVDDLHLNRASRGYLVSPTGDGQDEGRRFRVGGRVKGVVDVQPDGRIDVFEYDLRGYHLLRDGLPVAHKVVQGHGSQPLTLNLHSAVFCAAPATILMYRQPPRVQVSL